jgi:hypothetical protein
MLSKKYNYALFMYVVHVVQLQAVTLHVRTIHQFKTCMSQRIKKCDMEP